MSIDVDIAAGHARILRSFPFEIFRIEARFHPAGDPADVPDVCFDGAGDGGCACDARAYGRAYDCIRFRF